jgi:hypothetical protein
MARHALVAWTVLIWATRVRNILEDGGSVPELLVPALLVVLAVAALVDRSRALFLLVAATVAVWAVRVPLIVTRDHSAAFVAVHVVLAVVSVSLAALALREARRAPGRVPA